MDLYVLVKQTRDRKNKISAELHDIKQSSLLTAEYFKEIIIEVINNGN